MISRKPKYPTFFKVTNISFSISRASTSTSTSTLFHKTVIGYNRLARKIAIANLGGPVKRKIN